MAHLRTTPTSLRFLILSALGASFSACGAQIASDGGDLCTDGKCVTGGSAGTGGDTGGQSVGGASTGGRASGGASTGGTSSGGSAAGGSATGGSATGGSATGGSGTGGEASFPGCTDPQPLLAEADTGIYRCSEGYLHRQRAETCPTALPREIDVEFPSLMGGANGADPGYTVSKDECSSDADCATNAYCNVSQTNAVSYDGCLNAPLPEPEVPDFARACVQGCREDSDCGDNQMCMCGSMIGYCKTISGSSGCHEDADCTPGYHCLENAREGNFGVMAFACQLPGDTCQTDSDCSPDFCTMSPDGKSCQVGAVCGRPFLVEGVGRTAAVTLSATWLVGEVESQLTRVTLPVSAEVRSALAEHWSRVGLLEHASIAAFARFTLQLLSLGAPADLVEASTRAQADEARHARLAFALASHYAGDKRGPGPLSLDGALEASSFEEILRTTLLEGCMGETRAALEASRGAELCDDPIVRAVLEGIAADEARHAELAWRVVRWMTEQDRRAFQIVVDELTQAEERERIAGRSRASRISRPPSRLERFGVLEERALDACHRSAHRDVIAPCARTLLAMSASVG